jgi:hypothetical protein
MFVDVLYVQPRTSEPGRTTPYYIPKHLEATVRVQYRGIRGGEITEELISYFHRRLRAPVIGLLGAADDGAPLEAPRDAERPAAVGVLARDGCVARV